MRSANSPSPETAFGTEWAHQEGVRSWWVGRLETLPRRWIIALFLATVVIVTMQRGVLDRSHTTYPIFRQSYHHLVAGRDLYAAYPAEQGGAPQD